MEHGHDSPLQIHVSADDAVVTVVVAGELDITTATNLIRRLLTIGAAHPERLVLDLSGLVFVDVAGARALDAVYEVMEAECPVIVRPPRPLARKVFGIAGVMQT
jgi:anti-sigma B factor antagonist